MKLSSPQHTFLERLPTKYRAFVGGLGSGKTFIGCTDLGIFAMRHPKTVQGYFGPSYPSIRDVFFPTIEEVGFNLGFNVDIKEGNKECHFYRAGSYYGTVICRSMDRPGSIIGFKVARALVDELDTLPRNKAKQAWNRIIARLRLVIPGVENGVGVTTTPEGFGLVYDLFARDPSQSYSMVQASTHENKGNLPPDYISSLIETYPESLVDAYIHGKFVNLTHGSVYRSYNRERNRSSEWPRLGERLHIGMDFNVGKMAACVFVERGKQYHCVAEIVDGIDTPWMIEAIQNKYPKHPVCIYPDASGASTSSKGASLSDITLLHRAGFRVDAPKANPRIKDRVAAVNKRFEDQDIYVNDKAAPNTARCLEQQAYDDNGEPDKKSGLDHLPDAFGYFVHRRFPIVRPVVITGIGSIR